MATVLDVLTAAMTSLQAIADGGGAEAADAQSMILFLQHGGPFQNAHSQILVQAAMKADVPLFTSVENLFNVKA